ncbi:MAG: protein kinase [Verrucomicrobiota bacterium]
MIPIAHALHYAHQRGILHRDVKPSNILVGEDGIPRMVDFGLARIAESDEVLSLVTQNGTLLGTPDRTGCGIARINTAADINSLGAVLYEWVSGQPPDGSCESDALSTIIQLLARIEKEPPPLLKSAHRDLQAIVDRALSKTVGQRYETARALARDLEWFRSGLPVEARRQT